VKKQNKKQLKAAKSSSSKKSSSKKSDKKKSNKNKNSNKKQKTTKSSSSKKEETVTKSTFAKKRPLSDVEEGELSGSDLNASDPSSESSESSVFSDGYDSDYIGDEEDRRRLDNMTEKEREEEIYRRTEQRDILLKRFQLQKKLKQQEKDARRAERQKRRAEKQKLKKASKKKSAKFADQEEHEEGQEENNYENNQSPKLNDKTNNLSDFLDNESSPLKNATGSSSMDRRKVNESKKKDTGVSKALANLKADREKKKQIAEDNRQRLEKLQQQQKKLRTEDVFSSSSSDDDESVGKKRIRSKSSGSSGSQASSASGSESGSESDSGSGSSSDSESAAASKLPITTKEELNKAKLSRFKIEKWCHAPFFKQVACGCFVRIGIGLNQGISIYRVAQIVDVVETAKVYQLGTTKTNKGFKLKHGGEERTYRLEFVSNQPFTDDEFKRWKDALNKADMNPPSIREIENKHKELQSYVNYRFKDEDIDVIVKEKKRFIKDTDKIAEKKIELLKKKQEATESNDLDIVKDIEQQIEDLNEKATDLNIKRSGNFNLLALVLYFIILNSYTNTN
jgi:RNA polymerase-associated protein RTF1